MENTYPFKVDFENLTFVAEIESSNLFSNYFPLFAKYQYEGNGYAWEGLIVQIIEKKNQELLNYISFDPEAGCFYAKCSNAEILNEVLQIIVPTFSNLEVLEDYIQNADRERIDD
ncbi:Imm51 family immunity protein [Flammeovirga sp. SubArs3]|uniref:Imm51 family immunity protein n=1 Tax=Flammeovirga sp. SubArs3 TaxID=2995316 RepID=UPI00248AADFC|nr:Imm51 family immunity protein [Flammeovirga sp. SubArs3]